MSEAKPYSIPKQLVWEAYQRVKAKRGAGGVDGESLAEFDKDLKGNLYKIWNRMSSGSYQPPPVKLVEVEKKSGGVRRLGVPAVEDRVVQMAVKLVIEPLFEADFLPCSYGFRPKRTTRMALDGIVGSLNEGYTEVGDVDLKSYFDTINHEQLMKQVERREAGGKTGSGCAGAATDSCLVESRSDGRRKGDASCEGLAPRRSDFTAIVEHLPA